LTEKQSEGKMQGDDDDRYDLDESNMFQTSFNDSNCFAGSVSQAQPAVQKQQQIADSIDFQNESQATFI